MKRNRIIWDWSRLESPPDDDIEDCDVESSDDEHDADDRDLLDDREADFYNDPNGLENRGP